jgi:2'-5' RNA ligase
MTRERFSFWLIPAEAERPFLQQTITRWAERWDAPPFIPHVTLYVAELLPAEAPLALLAAAAQDVPPFSLAVQGTAMTAQFTKSLFLELEETAPLLTLHRRLAEAVKRPSGYQLDPHLSLLYRRLPAAEKEALLADFTPPPRIHFDQVRAVATGDKTRTPADVAAWREVGRVQLRTSNR